MKRLIARLTRLYPCWAQPPAPSVLEANCAALRRESCSPFWKIHENPRFSAFDRSISGLSSFRCMPFMTRPTSHVASFSFQTFHSAKSPIPRQSPQPACSGAQVSPHRNLHKKITQTPPAGGGKVRSFLRFVCSANFLHRCVLCVLKACIEIHCCVPYTQKGRGRGRVRSREVIDLLTADGWFEVAVKGSHHQFKHPTKVGRVTVPHPKSEIAKGTLHSILKTAGLK